MCPAEKNNNLSSLELMIEVKALNEYEKAWNNSSSTSFEISSSSFDFFHENNTDLLVDEMFYHFLMMSWLSDRV